MNINEVLDPQPEPTLGRGVDVQAPRLDECVKQPIDYRPSRNECLRDYSINIEFLSVGCVIRVGCKSVPFSTVKEGMKALNNYVANPYETRKIWEERFNKEEEL
jgi:hypothetical protein